MIRVGSRHVPLVLVSRNGWYAVDMVGWSLCDGFWERAWNWLDIGETGPLLKGTCFGDGDCFGLGYMRQIRDWAMIRVCVLGVQ
jgi:hypothetical protein